MANRTTRIDPAMIDRLADMAHLDRNPAAVRKRVEGMEHLLERLFVIPGINRPVGLDVILDLIPVVGGTVGAALGAWMAWEARNVGMTKLPARKSVVEGKSVSVRGQLGGRSTHKQQQIHLMTAT